MIFWQINLLTLKRQPNEIVKHTQTVCWQQPLFFKAKFPSIDFICENQNSLVYHRIWFNCKKLKGLPFGLRDRNEINP